MSRGGSSARLEGDLGAKLGPRIVDLVAQSVLATRRGLGPHEARVLAAGLKLAVDEMGHEHAAFMAPFTSPALAEVDMPQVVRDWLGRSASGVHQWESRALAQLGFGGASSALGTVLSNYLYPVTGGLVSANPHLAPDPGTLAGLAARHWIAEGTGQLHTARQGMDAGWWQALLNAAHSWPALAEILELERRGVLGAGGWYNLMRIAGYNAEAIPLLRHLQRQLLSPADAALGVLRGNLEHPHALAIAEANGLDPGDFQTLIENTGEPLGLMQLLEAYRRGIIDKPRLERGILQSRVRNEWIGVAEQLRYEPMSTADAADAALRGHLTENAAQAIAAENGLRPGDWPAYFANQGNPPAPEQLLELWRRGFIDRATVRRGLREGRTRNDWITTVEQLRYEPISTADAVDAWLRGHIDRPRAEQIMAENGLIPRDHDIAFADAGNPLGLEELLEAFRRGFIDAARFERGFRESRYRNEWHEVALRLRFRPMSTADAVEASIQGHLTKERARKLAEENGLEAGDFEALWQTAGSPLSRTESEQLYNRGLMSAAQVEQALRESRLKPKYTALAMQLHVREPEARAVVQMLEFGAIGPHEALTELLHLGYTQRVASAFVAEGEARATGGHKQLATGQIAALYESHLIGRGEAEQLLGKLHYTSGTAAMILHLADHARRQRILATGLTAVRTRFLHHHATETEATADLAVLGLPADSIALYLRVWQLERKAVVRDLTEAQIVKAHKHSLLGPTPAENDAGAAARLGQLGYSPGDAQILLELG